MSGLGRVQDRRPLRGMGTLKGSAFGCSLRKARVQAEWPQGAQRELGTQQNRGRRHMTRVPGKESPQARPQPAAQAGQDLMPRRKLHVWQMDCTLWTWKSKLSPK